MTRNRRWIYFWGALGLTLILVAVVIAADPNYLGRSPEALPAPGEVAEATREIPPADADFGQQPLQPVIEEDGVPTYHLTLKKVMWDVGGGTFREAYTVNGAVPGPMLRVKEGELTRFRVKNELGEPSSIHWHGMILPPEQDGVSHLSQDPIEDGEEFVYEYRPGPAGTHWYHSHFDGAHQVMMGLYGPLIVEPSDPTHPAHANNWDSEHIVMIGDAGLGLTMSGKDFPFNQAMKVETGQRVLIRMINVGVGNHPMHLHGHEYYIVAKDGNPIAHPPLVNTVDIAPGDTYDVAFIADNPGSWLFHCHILPHAEGPDGMFGLTALLEYKGYEPDPNNPHAHQAPSARRLPGVPGKHGH